MAKQESLGLRVVTDGEYRRDFWHLDFLRRLEGVGVAPITGVKFQAEDVPPMPTVIGRVRCGGPIMADDFRYVASVASATPKLAIPAPAMLHLRGGRAAISREHYPGSRRVLGRRGRRVSRGDRPRRRGGLHGTSSSTT